MGEKTYQPNVFEPLKARKKLVFRFRGCHLRPAHSESAETVLKSIESESNRLQKIASEKYIDGGALYREFLQSIDKNDLDSAKLQLSEFGRTRPPKEYSNDLRDQLSAALAQIKLIETQKKAEAKEEARKAKEDAKKKAKKKSK